MTDTNRTPPPPAAYVPPTQASVDARFQALLLEIDHLQAHTGATPALHAARESMLRAMTCVGAHCQTIAQEAKRPATVVSASDAAAASAELAATAPPSNSALGI